MPDNTSAKGPAAPAAKPMVRVRPFSYQPNKRELENDVSVDASPEDVRAALMRSVKVVDDPETQ